MKHKSIQMAAGVFAAIWLFVTPVFALNVSARSAVLMDGDTGQVLWEKNADEKSLIASTTKIMTALLVLENAELDEVVEIPTQAVGIEGSSMYLEAGERYTVEDLLHGLMLQSGNDAAVALAIHVAGSLEDFVSMMNEKAADLDLKNMHFANPNGLDDEGNYASAKALGRLAVTAMENADFRRIVSTKHYSCGKHSFSNHNKLLWQYDGAVGVKTGFTKQAGRILVGSAERLGRRLIAVTIHAPDDWRDHSTLFDYGFSQYEQQVLVSREQHVGSLTVISGTAESVPILAGEEVSRYLLPGEGAELKLSVAPFVYAPVKAGEPCGSLGVWVSGAKVAEIPVFTGATVEKVPEEPGFWDKIFNSLKGEES